MRIKFSGFFAIIMLVSCMEPVARKPIVVKSSSFMKESVEFNKTLIEKEEAQFRKLMNLDSSIAYVTSPKGFWYYFNFKSPETYNSAKGDVLSFSYDVFNISGDLIYDSNEIGEKTYYVDEQDILEGLRNGLKLMHEGDVVTFLFPSHKVFGYLGDGNKIGINQPLIYKVQLNKIKKKNESN